METKMDDKVFEAAAQAPKVFVSASLGEGDEYNREPGIQLTKDQIISLRKYETLGLSLPVQLGDVMSYLNYGAGEAGGVGLTGKDFLRTFTMTYDHARRWSPLREKIMLTGTDLKIFAGSIIRIGNGIVEVYDDLKASRYLEEHDINTPEEYQELKFRIPGLPDLDLPSGDVPEIKLYLNDMLFKVRQCHDKAQRVRVELDSFGTDMREKILPEIKLRLEFVCRNTYQADVQALQNEIDQRSKEIDELNKQYDQLVQEAIKSAATLNVGGLILGIYQGVKAEKIRRERNALKELQQVSNSKMASKNQTLNSLNKVRDDLQNLSYVAIEAEVATQNLMLVWSALATYITASFQEVDDLKGATSLRRFKNQILAIIEPWAQIKTSSDQLLGVFAAAEREYEQSRLILRSKTSMFSFNATKSPAFNMSTLLGHNSEIQTANTNAQMLFQQFDYLPGTVASLNDLAIAISRTTFDVRSLAQTSSINLEKTVKRLKGFQSEFGDPDEAQEIREDMEVELQNAYKKVSAQTEDLKSIHKGVGVPYDREASQQWVVELQKDRAVTEALEAKTAQKLVELQEQMKSVSEAIDVIGKAGVEKIGQEAQLSMDSLKALGLAPPQVQIALLAVDALKKMIAGIGEAISFLNMLEGYNRLKEKAGDLRVQLQKQRKEIVRIEGKIELVKALDELDKERWGYVSELSNLVSDFDQYSRDLKQDKSLPVEDRAESAIARMVGITKNLKAIQQQ